MTIRLWDAGTGRESKPLSGHAKRAVWSVALSPDSKRLESVGWDNHVKLWYVDSGHEIMTLEDHIAAVVGVAYSPAGDRTASY